MTLLVLTLLEQMRLANGDSRGSLAVRADVTERCIFSIEREGRVPRRKTAAALENALGCPPGLLRRASVASKHDKAAVDAAAVSERKGDDATPTAT